MKDNYSFIAPFYSLLVRVVFGTSLKKVKIVFAQDLDQKRILIIGGGDGLDYQELAGQICGEYWELSDSMLRKAKKNLSGSKLEFQFGHFEAESESLFDEVWLHFVLDTFTDLELEKFLAELKGILKPGARLYLADFFDPVSLDQRFIQFSMMCFFRVFTQHPRVDLPQYEKFLAQAGFESSIDCY